MDAMVCFQSVVGLLYLVEQDRRLTGLHFSPEKLPEDIPERETPLLKQAKTQLWEYFAGDRKTFDLPLRMEGTDFQMEVWAALQDIPYGETRTYKDIAQAMGSPKAVRAVGTANNRNPIAIIVPCHRVIGANGKLAGYGGGVENKQKLLELEQRFLTV